MSDTMEIDPLDRASPRRHRHRRRGANRAFDWRAIAGRRDPWSLAAVAIPTLLALALVIHQLSLPAVLLGIHTSPTLGIEYDDGVYLGAAIRFVHGLLPYRNFDFVQPPGIVWLMSPIAFLGRLIGERDAMALARCATALVVTLNAGLAALVVRRRGATAMLTAGLAVAAFPLAVSADHSLTLEPFLVFFCLIGTMLLFRDGRLPGSRRVLLAGLAFGFAGTVKLWAVLPIVAAFICCCPQVRSALRPLLKGCVLGFGLPSLPFFIAAPGAFVREVVLDQVHRSSDVIRGSLSIGQRLVEITGLGGLSHFTNATTLAEVITFGLLALAVFTYGFARDCTRSDWFVLLAALVVIPAMFLSPQFYDYYSYFPHVFLSLLLAVCVGQFTTILCRFVQRDGQHRGRDLLLRAAPATIVVALAIAVIPSDVTYADGYLTGSIDPGPVASAVIPQGSCVTFDQPGLAINANRFVPSASGCPAIVDPFGMFLTRNDGDQPGSPQSLVPAFVADWRTWLAQSQYVMLTVQLSDFIPWTPALITWFNSHFTLVSSAPHTFVYKNNAFSPSTASGKTQQKEAAQLIAAGLTAEQQGRTDLAYSDYRKALTKDHSNAVALYDLGHIDQERGQIAQAADEYQAALKADPTFTDALYNMGVLDASGNPTAAVLYYTRTVQLEPNDAAANFNLGVLLIKLGHIVQGDVYLKTALRLDPSLASDLPPGITAPSSGPS